MEGQKPIEYSVCVCVYVCVFVSEGFMVVQSSVQMHIGSIEPWIYPKSLILNLLSWADKSAPVVFLFE